MAASYTKENVSGVVLAGGKSSRFGSDKGLHPFRGMPLAANALEIIRPHCMELLISTGNAAAYAFTGARPVEDIFRGCGPMGGIHSALTHARGELLMVIGCDMPLVPPALFGFLLEQIGNHEVVMPVHGGFTETMCAIYRRSCLPGVERALQSKTYKILEVVAGLDARFVEIDQEAFCHPGMFRNVNTRSDLPR
jgi:molybdenum cofactor guanylyltransferase